VVLSSALIVYKMSSDELMMCFCASCGIAEVDNIKLMECDGCDLVRYCSEKCQEEHRPKHGEISKERAAELRDEILFRQPESSRLGDCPICCLPLPIPCDVQKHNCSSSPVISMHCCSQVICKGCYYANRMREREQSLPTLCPYCRHPAPKTEEAWKEETEKRRMKRLEANDPVALQELGVDHYHDGDYGSSIKCWRKAAVLGDVVSHYQMSIMYREGKGVQKDMKKAIYHAEQAAIGGDPKARYNLGVEEMNNGRIQRAVRHHIIAASLGYEKSLEVLRKHYAAGCVQKNDFAAALRAHQAAVDATKSPQREKGEEWYRRSISE